MSARIKKDLKNLRTEWALAILLTIAPILIARLMGVTAREFIIGHFAFLAICTAWIGAAAFGKDLSIGALSFSFAQLECRHLLWKEKIQTIGGIALALFLASFFSLGFLMEPVAPGQAPWSIGSTSLMPLAFLGITITLSCVGGGLFYSLTLRSYQGAFWLALLTPLVIAVVLIFPILFSSLPSIPPLYWSLICLVTLVHGLALGFTGYKKFLAWEDLGPFGGDIWLSLKPGKKLGETPQTRKRAYRPILGLLKKELYLQQMNLIICFSILALYAITTPFYDPRFASTDVAALLAYFARLVLLFFLPIAIGAAAISEERRLGISQWQATLPASLPRQWFTKLITAYGVTLVATVLAPVAVDSFYADFWSRLPFTDSLALVVSIGIPFLATTLGFYASSLSQSFLVSLGASLVALVGGSSLYYLVSKLLVASVTLEGTAIPQLLLAVILLILGLPLFWVLSFHNYRIHQSFTARLPLNGAVWLAMTSIAFLLSHQIYGRTWDRFVSTPAPKPSAIKEGVVPTVIPGTWTAVLAPNGTLWASKSQLQYNNELKTEDRMKRIGADSDWVRVFSSLKNAYLLKRDGRLFSARKWGAESMTLSAIPDPNPDQSWTNVMAGHGASIVVGMKADGSLWQWTEDNEGTLSEIIPYLADYKWESVSRDDYFYVGVAQDNTLWAWGSTDSHRADGLQNPLIQKVHAEARKLFPNDGPPKLNDPEVQKLLQQSNALLKEHGLDVTDTNDKTAASTFLQERLREEKAYETPYPISTLPHWKSVRFSHRLPRRNSRAVAFHRQLIATQLDGTTWTSSESGMNHWNQAPESRNDVFTQISPESIPRQSSLGFDGHTESVTLIDSLGALRETRFPSGHKLTFSLTTDHPMRSNRTDWVSFFKDGYSITAMTADGILWHAGPFPIDRQPNAALTLLIPSSRKLRPVFDLINGKPL